KSAQIREILISESAWEEMTCLFAPSLVIIGYCKLMALENTCIFLRYEITLLKSLMTHCSKDTEV
ncbi:hypothetical protein RZP76_23015, partial [Raoultella ornithinolytica]|nr:hypothetical protein [Raoultella ornithinolytica]